MDETQFLALITAILSQHSHDEPEQCVAKARGIIATAHGIIGAGEAESGTAGEADAGDGTLAAAAPRKARIRAKSK